MSYVNVVDDTVKVSVTNQRLSFQQKENLDESSMTCNIEGLSLSIIGGPTLVEGASLQILQGRCYGLYGLNGCGKSTLIKVLQRKAIPFMPQHWHIAEVKQEEVIERPQSADYTCIQYVIDSDERLAQLKEEEEDLLDAIEENRGDTAAHSDRLTVIYDLMEELEETAQERALKALKNLRFTTKRANSAPHLQSGGWQMRLRIACALYSGAQCLLWDEPTNHLDVTAVFTLQKVINELTASKRFSIVVVSHDRAFLESVTTDIIHMAHKQMHQFAGGFAEFIEMSEQRALFKTRRLEKQNKIVQHYEETVAKLQQNASKGSTGQQGMISSRQNRLEQYSRGVNVKHDNGKRYHRVCRYGQNWNGKLQPLPIEKPARFSLESGDGGKLSEGECILGFKKASVGYGADALCIEGMDLSLTPGKVVGIVGMNGCGKTTLLRTMAGELELLAGERIVNPWCRISKYSQSLCEAFPLDVTPERYMIEKHKLKPLEARSHLGAVGLGGDVSQHPISTLSGGQKARLAYCDINCECPNVLLLDEPSNHLDLLTVDVLIEAIANFQGTVVIVSHDQYIMESCDEVYMISGKQKKLKKVQGGFAAYREQVMLRLEGK